MLHVQLLNTNGISIRARALDRIALRAAAVGRNTHPATFAHVQPHAHAATSLTGRFVTALASQGRSRMPPAAEIEFGARLHDIGKYFIPTSLLLKPGPLDEKEQLIMSLHPVYSSIIVEKLNSMTDTIYRAVLHHHEHWDGSGYPEGLAGTNIPLEARIVSIADVYSSLRARRSYKPIYSKWDAFAMLLDMAGRELDPYLVEDFVRLMRDKQPLRHREL